MEIVDNVIYFDCDDDFTDYAIMKNPTVYYSDETSKYWYDYGYTDEYSRAIADNMEFYIKDKKSLINKRGSACRGVITKPISNLKSKWNC